MSFKYLNAIMFAI